MFSAHKFLPFCSFCSSNQFANTTIRILLGYVVLQLTTGYSIVEQYVGCFRDTNPNRSLPEVKYFQGSLTVQKCIDYCKGYQSTFAGPQYSYECYCGETFDLHGSADNCDMTCDGNRSEICGGSYALSVHSVCEFGYYGSECNQRCGQCVNRTLLSGKSVQMCSLKEGNCLPTPSVCLPGWTGKNCSFDINECSNSSNHSSNCSEVCINLPGSYKCSCHSGFVLNSDGVSCKDIDECSESTHNNCSQTCSNVLGSYTCSCQSGYILNTDGVTCSTEYFHEEQYIGCYRDNDTRALPYLVQNIPHNYNRIERCIDACRVYNDNGFTYAGLEAGVKCFCGDRYNRYGPAGNCNIDCTGNRSQKCGGLWALNVYAVCPFGYYGARCDRRCRQCVNVTLTSDNNKSVQMCSLINGECTGGCVPGWTGSNCSVDSSWRLRFFTAVVIFSLLLLAVSLIAIIFFMLYRRQRRQLEISSEQLHNMHCNRENETTTIIETTKIRQHESSITKNEVPVVPYILNGKEPSALAVDEKGDETYMYTAVPMASKISQQQDINSTDYEDVEGVHYTTPNVDFDKLRLSVEYENIYEPAK